MGDAIRAPKFTRDVDEKQEGRRTVEKELRKGLRKEQTCWAKAAPHLGRRRSSSRWKGVEEQGSDRMVFQGFGRFL